MQQLPLTLDTPAANLALDEALLDEAEAGEITTGVLRLWELPSYCVVLGRSSPAASEVHLDACQKHQIPVLRRCSGGGTILAGPGCLLYSLVLDFQTHPQIQAIDLAHQYVLNRLTATLSTETIKIQRAGTSDLAIAPSGTNPAQKFSGNALRIKRRHVLYHGTLLYDFDLDQIPRFLATPTRIPDYRDARPHRDFVTNLPQTRDALAESLIAGWQANSILEKWPQQRTADLLSSKYHNDPKWVVLPSQ